MKVHVLATQEEWLALHAWHELVCYLCPLLYFSQVDNMVKLSRRKIKTFALPFLCCNCYH